MGSYGITATGFVKPTLAEIKSDWEALFRQAFGSSINLLPPSNMATIIGIAAGREAATWDGIEETYLSRARSTAQGVSLDNVGELTLDERIAAAPSKTFKQYFFGTPGTVIPTNFIATVSSNPSAEFSPTVAQTLGSGTNEVQLITFSATPDAGTWTITMPDGQVTAALAYNANAAAVQAAIRLLTGFDGVTVSGNYSIGFTVTYADGATVGSAGAQPWALLTPHSSVTHTSAAVVITASETTLGVGQAVATMQALANGPTVADAKTLTTIQTPITGLTATKNLDDATVGRLVELDADYRLRQVDDLQQDSAATLEAIRIALKKVTDVTDAIVYENTAITTDGNGVPGKSIHAYVDGGVNQDIFNALWAAVGGGIQTYGSVTGTVVDSQGFNQTVSFDRPTDKPVYTIVTITKNSAYPTNGDALVVNALLAYGATLAIGDDVLLYPKLLPAIVDNVPGIEDINIKIGFAPSPSSSVNLAIAANERATFASGNTTVNSS